MDFPKAVLTNYDSDGFRFKFLGIPGWDVQINIVIDCDK